MLKAVIFDMDGVIIDSEPLHARAIILALRNYGIELAYDSVSRFIGGTVLSMCETLKEEYGLAISAKELSMESARQTALLHKKEGYTPIPFVKELIIDLHRHGILLAIASSSSPELIEQIVQVFGLQPYFTKLVSGVSVMQSKPAPDIFRKACDELGVTPQEAIVIEDSCNGVLASVRAGIPAIGFLNPNSGHQDLSRAAILIESFEEINTHFIRQVYCHANNLPAPVTSTKRLETRELAMEDLPSLLALYRDETFTAAGLFYADSLEDAKTKHEAYIKHMYQFAGLGLWGVFLSGTNQLIGHCGLEPKQILTYGIKKEIIELGYGIRREDQRKGYAREAVKAILEYAVHTLYLDEIYTVISPDNQASLRFSKSLGFQEIGTAAHLPSTHKDASSPKDLLLFWNPDNAVTDRLYS